MMNENEKTAAKIAKNIKWSSEDAFEIAYALLTECNLHSEAEALKAKFEEITNEAEEERIEDEMIEWGNPSRNTTV